MARYLSTFICAILLLSPMRSFSQTVNFEKLFRDSQILYSVQATTDNRYILSGLASEDGTEEWRLDMDGNVYALQQISDGGYIFCGGELPSPFIDRGWLVKTDQNGYYQSLILYQPEDGIWIQFLEAYRSDKNFIFSQ